METSSTYTAIVIGAGPAGYTCAIRLAQLGVKVAIVERDLIGGICINWGCTPSKAMIASAKLARAFNNSKHYGIYPEKHYIDFNKIAHRRDQIIEKSRNHISQLLSHWNIDLIQGEGEILDANHVRVNSHVFIAKNIVIATGSGPLIPEFLKKNDTSIVNSNRLITIDKLPNELTIVGGGIIGLEFATMFVHFGTKVRIIEYADRILSVFDKDISHEAMQELEKLGVEVLTGHKVLDISNAKVEIEKISTGEKFILNSPMNLIAIGHKANINHEKLDEVGLAYNLKGIETNNSMQTSIENIYAIGDATGKSILAHVAVEQGLTVAENIMGNKREMNYKAIPAILFTLPEIATVGEVPQDLTNIDVFKYPFKANLRSVLESHENGFVKLWIERSTKKLIAVQMIGEMAGEIIQGYTNIIALDLDIERVVSTIHAHPSYNEIVRNSLEYVLGRSIEYIG